MPLYFISPVPFFIRTRLLIRPSRARTAVKITELDSLFTDCTHEAHRHC